MAETPQFAVLKKDQKMELRQYPGYLQAEVDVAAQDYKSAVERGFDILAGYIFGSNTSRQKIEMTTPVQVSQPEKIAMTTPVTVRGSGTYTVAFIMPSKYTLETLPIPRSTEIRFSVVPPHRAAVIRFSGYFQGERIERHKELLGQWIAQQGLTADGDFTIAGYDPPWVPWFLARNEVMVRVAAD